MAQKESAPTLPDQPKKPVTPDQLVAETPEVAAPSTPKPSADTSDTSAAVDAPRSAPDLPATVAHQYGLHRYRSPVRHEDGTPASSDDAIPEDAETQAAVDEIVAQESDTVLEAEDARFTPAEPPKKRGFWRTLFSPVTFWWRHKWLRWLTILLILGAAGAVAAIPETRYKVLNKAGVTSSARLTILDQSTQLPLKNVKVSLAGATAQTDKDGKATLRELPLGPATLQVERIAFAPLTKEVTVGWGSNPLGSFSMTATGVQYTIVVTDFLSGKPLEGAEASSDGDINALADKQGKITLTVSDANLTELDVQITLAGYRTEPLKLRADQSAVTTAVTLVPAQKTAFVSKTSGKYDLYTMDLDGKNRAALLPGTGRETQNISLTVNSAGDRAALVSTRDAVRDPDGYLLGTLTLVDLKTGATTTVEHAPQIQLIDWIGNRLVYRMGQPGAANADEQRYRLVSYDYQSKSRQQLDAANEFTDIVSVGGIVYYAVSHTDSKGQPGGFFKIRPDGTSKINLFQEEVWSIQRSAYDTLLLQTPDKWFSYAVGTLQPTPTEQSPTFNGRAYIDNASGERSLWIDERDGKGTLLVHDNKANTDTVVHAQEGLAYPVRWLNEHTVVFRVTTAAETTDYAKSLLGGDARKLSDVTNTFGYAR
jgi:hypothetical protein